MKNTLASVGKAPRVKDIQAIVFHDRDGRIHHMHHVIMLEGACPVEYDTMKQQALENAKMIGVEVSQLEILHVSKLQNPHAMHRVDMKKKMLMEMKQPENLFPKLPKK